MQVDYGSGPVEVRCNLLTLTVYEQEFDGADMVKDLVGGTSDGSTYFDRTNWKCLPKALWACIKSADPSAPPYRDWARATAGVDLRDLDEAVGVALSRDLFPGTRQKPDGE